MDLLSLFITEHFLPIAVILMLASPSLGGRQYIISMKNVKARSEKGKTLPLPANH